MSGPGQADLYVLIICTAAGNNGATRRVPNSLEQVVVVQEVQGCFRQRMRMRDLDTHINGHGIRCSGRSVSAESPRCMPVRVPQNSAVHYLSPARAHMSRRVRHAWAYIYSISITLYNTYIPITLHTTEWTLSAHCVYGGWERRDLNALTKESLEITSPESMKFTPGPGVEPPVLMAC